MNRYAIERQVGIGAFGEVSRATQNSTGEVVAVKRMRQRFASWEECLQLREIISLRRLQHPCIIKLKEVVRENTELFLIFEYMDQNVYQISRQRSEALGSSGATSIFTEKEIRSIMAQTLLGLQAIHKGGFMHRDLKPENLLTKGDMVKIADFGLAKEIRSRPPFTDYVSTRWYRAPEICLRSTNYNSPIDIWACGVIFAELYLNRALFPGSSDSDQIFKMCSVLGAPTAAEWEEGHLLARRLNIRFPSISPTPLRTMIGNLASPAALDLIEQMLRYNPQDRPTSTQCLQHAFFTGSPNGLLSSTGGGFGGDGSSVSATMFQGIVTGQPHNPFHIAAGVPTSTSGGLGGTVIGQGGINSGNGSRSGDVGRTNSPSSGGTPIPSPGPGQQNMQPIGGGYTGNSLMGSNAPLGHARTGSIPGMQQQPQGGTAPWERQPLGGGGGGGGGGGYQQHAGYQQHDSTTSGHFGGGGVPPVYGGGYHSGPPPAQQSWGTGGGGGGGPAHHGGGQYSTGGFGGTFGASSQAPPRPGLAPIGGGGAPLPYPAYSAGAPVGGSSYASGPSGAPSGYGAGNYGGSHAAPVGQPHHHGSTSGPPPPAPSGGGHSRVPAAALWTTEDDLLQY